MMSHFSILRIREALTCNKKYKKLTIKNIAQYHNKSWFQIPSKLSSVNIIKALIFFTD